MSTPASDRRARLASIMAAQVAAAVPDSTSKLEITDIRLSTVQEPVSRRVYGIVRVGTRGGLIGFGEGLPVADSNFARSRQFWMGRPATAYVTAGPLLPLSGALDMALLDIIGKSCNAPVYRVLGGPTRNKIRAFTSLEGANPSAIAAALDRAKRAGYRVFGVSIPPPGARNQGQAYQRDLRQMLDGLRAGLGEQFDFVMDGGAALSPGDAASVAMTIEPMHPLWFDEPVAISNAQTIRKIADESVVPLGFGRHIANPGVYQELLRESLIDVLRPDIAREGITLCRRIAAMAEPYYAAVAPHHQGGPIATAAAIQLAASLPNFFIQHIPLPAAEPDRLMRADIAGATVERVHEGFAALPTAPGLGITINEAALEKYHVA